MYVHRLAYSLSIYQGNVFHCLGTLYAESRVKIGTNIIITGPTASLKLESVAMRMVCSHGYLHEHA